MSSIINSLQNMSKSLQNTGSKIYYNTHPSAASNALNRIRESADKTAVGNPMTKNYQPKGGKTRRKTGKNMGGKIRRMSGRKTRRKI